MADLETATDLNIALMKTALSHFIQHAENVKKSTEAYTFVDDLHFALDRYFEENAVALQITDTHDLHAALELCGYKIMYSGVSTSIVNDPSRSGLVVHGFEIDMSAYEGDEEEEDEDDDDEDDEEDEEDEEEEGDVEDEEAALIAALEEEEEEEDDEDEEEARRKSKSKKDRSKGGKSDKTKKRRHA